MRTINLRIVAIGCAAALLGCADENPQLPLRIPFRKPMESKLQNRMHPPGNRSAGSSLVRLDRFRGEAGKGSFIFGAATAAAQIEEDNADSDWWVWTLEPEGKGMGTFVGEAVQGYSRQVDDIQMIQDLSLDAYRFNVNWPRVEPERDVIREEALDHYSEFLDALLEKKIRPMITVHHFSNPIWVDDPMNPDCTDGPTDTHLCGWHHPEGGR